MQMGDINLDQELTNSEEDPKLSEMLLLSSYLEVEFVRPPQISTLKKWGQVVVPSGKHKLKTHAQIFDEDLIYCLLLTRRTSLSSPWSLSLKNYILARLRAAAQAADQSSHDDYEKGLQKQEVGQGGLKEGHTQRGFRERLQHGKQCQVAPD